MNSCPICSSESKKIKSFSVNEIRELLSNHFQNECSTNVDILDYSIFECNNCKFQYAFPFIQGSNSFYSWVTKQDNYYPAFRWEYNKVLELTSSKNKISILDVGCGDGKFFDVLKSSNKEFEMLGIDTTEASIHKCKEKGFKSLCLDIDDYITQYPKMKFDYVVSFHCLEHLTNPVDFVSKLLTLTNDNGALYISTPFSPLTIEVDWTDILNYPPHHMGRWSSKSYLEVAKQLNVNVEFYHPKDLNLFYDSIESFLISEYNLPIKNIKSVKKKFLRSLFFKPHKFLFHLSKQIFRDKINGERASNVILAKFYSKIND